MRDLPNRLGWLAKRTRDIGLDTLYGVETGPDIAGERGPHAYDPTPWGVLRRAMRLASVRAEGSAFVDMGCGKGRVLISALTFPFTQVVGVELSPALAEIAEQNLRSARLLSRRSFSSEIVCIDATQFPIPMTPNVVFFYNPFPLETMLTVLQNIIRSHHKAARRITLIFYACSSIIPEVGEFLLSKSSNQPRRLASTNVGRRSINIFELL
jgi:SAM-dependent methyltransferase